MPEPNPTAKQSEPTLPLNTAPLAHFPKKVAVTTSSPSSGSVSRGVFPADDPMLMEGVWGNSGIVLTLLWFVSIDTGLSPPCEYEVLAKAPQHHFQTPPAQRQVVRKTDSYRPSADRTTQNRAKAKNTEKLEHALGHQLKNVDNTPWSSTRTLTIRRMNETPEP